LHSYEEAAMNGGFGKAYMHAIYSLLPKRDGYWAKAKKISLRITVQYVQGAA
jgi:hypothetical protein